MRCYVIALVGFFCVNSDPAEHIRWKLTQEITQRDLNKQSHMKVPDKEPRLWKSDVYTVGLGLFLCICKFLSPASAWPLLLCDSSAAHSSACKLLQSGSAGVSCFSISVPPEKVKTRLTPGLFRGDGTARVRTPSLTAPGRRPTPGDSVVVFESPASPTVFVPAVLDWKWAVLISGDGRRWWWGGERKQRSTYRELQADLRGKKNRLSKLSC